MDNMGVQK